MTLDEIKKSRADGVDRARKEWAERTKHEGEKQASPEIRELFKAAAEMGRKWKK